MQREIDMDEVVLSSEDLEMITESESEMEKKNKVVVEAESGADGMVRWDKIFPRMALRVLLVEADDSTRHIIAALLRKCSYRVVAVPDGLKAWEILKGRPHNVDLILTEVDLPSISGFALLTLIMEHEICKNIPVIMMSPQDSISTVYKCMLRGAADYLVKPIRRNELRNLWQHVWRRQNSTFGGFGPQDESVGQQKVEATSENNAASNHSSGYLACLQKNKEYMEKGSDAQSSCTKPDLEAESAHMENMQDFSLPIWGKSSLNDIKMQEHESRFKFVQQVLMHEREAMGSLAGACKIANTTTLDKDVESESQRRDANITGEACDKAEVLVNSSREAIDFVGAFNNHNSSSNNITSKFDTSPHLDLSLRRSHPTSFDNLVTEERHNTLRHSDASAFTRYTNRPLQSQHSTWARVHNHQKEFGTTSEKNLSNILTGCNSDAHGLVTQRSILSLANDQSKLSEVTTSCTQQRIFPVPVPVKGIRLNNPCTGYGSVLPPIYCTPSGPSPMPSPNLASQQEPAYQVNPFHQSKYESTDSEQVYERLHQNTNNSNNQTMHKQDHKFDALEDRGHISSATDQSTSSSFCNGAVSHLNSMGYGSTCGSNSNVDQVVVVQAAAETKNEEGFLTHSGNSHRSIQREVALSKFRLKRKDRCYEKKVRYESRKKLAEQRPRVKGQFVRRLHSDPPHEETENHYGNYFEC